MRTGVVLCVLTGCCCGDTNMSPGKELYVHNSKCWPLCKTIRRGRKQFNKRKHPNTKSHAYRLLPGKGLPNRGLLCG